MIAYIPREPATAGDRGNSMDFHQTGKNEQHSLDSGSFETTYSVYCGYRKARLEIIGFPLPLRGLGM